MSEPNQASGLGDLLGLLGGTNPMAALSRNLETMKKGVEGFVSSVHSFSATMQELETVVRRVTALLDEIEEPLRRFAAGAAPDGTPPAS